jgi:hypothetical protein
MVLSDEVMGEFQKELTLIFEWRMLESTRKFENDI